LSSSPEAERHQVEALAEATADANELDEALRREVARIVVELHRNPHHGELMGGKPPRVLKGCRKVRFDEPDWKGKPRYRFVYRNEPSDGAPSTCVVLAIGRRDRMIAYAKAARRVKEQAAYEGQSS
jgi:ParE toxin of type II toxin-antitoxin system, parDE